MATWKLEDAKNRFSELVRRALNHQPQLVTRHGRAAVVVLSAEDYERLTAMRNLRDFLRDSPLAEALASGDLAIERARETGRDIVF
jgi:antitoxin Phd